MAMTHYAPREYRKPKYDPSKSTLNICVKCCGRCIDTPSGIHCWRCGGVSYITCTEAQAVRVYAEISKAHQLAQHAVIELNYGKAG